MKTTLFIVYSLYTTFHSLEITLHNDILNATEKYTLCKGQNNYSFFDMEAQSYKLKENIICNIAVACKVNHLVDLTLHVWKYTTENGSISICNVVCSLHCNAFERMHDNLQKYCGSKYLAMDKATSRQDAATAFVAEYGMKLIRLCSEIGKLGNCKKKAYKKCHASCLATPLRRCWGKKHEILNITLPLVESVFFLTLLSVFDILRK